MKKRLSAGLMLIFMSIILIGLTSAYNTPIKVKTLSDHKVSIFVYESGKVAYEESYHIMSDVKGEVSVTHSSSSPLIDVMVKVTKDGQKVFLEKFESYKAGEEISIRMDYEEITGEYIPAEDNAVEDSVVAEETNESGKGEIDSTKPITGMAVSEGGKFSNVIYYIVGIFAVLFIVLLSVRFYTHRASKTSFSGAVSKNIEVESNKFNKVASKGETSNYNKPQKTSVQTNMLSNNNQNRLFGGYNPQASASPIQAQNDENEIERIERQMRELQREIGFIRNKEKIKTAEAKLESDRRELEKLKRRSGID